MKYTYQREWWGNPRSPPARVVWIEILRAVVCPAGVWSPPARVVWIEIVGSTNNVDIYPSPPARVVWIEIFKRWCIWKKSPVATREGGVD